MTIEEAANPQATEYLDNAVPEADEVQALDTAQDAEAKEPEEGQPEPEPEPELVEIEYEGRKHRVPPELRDAFLRQADYSRKTQALAAERKALEAARAELEQAAALTAEEIRAQARLQMIDEQIAAGRQVDWDQWHADEPEQAASAWRRFQIAVTERQEVLGALAEAKARRTAAEQQRAAKLREETESALAREFKDWSPAKRESLVEFAASMGYDPDVVRANATAADYRVLEDARKWREFSKRQAAAARIKAQQAAKPAVELSGGSASASPDVSRLSDAEWWEMRRNRKI